jgi:hypothetical protein
MAQDMPQTSQYMKKDTRLEIKPEC